MQSIAKHILGVLATCGPLLLMPGESGAQPAAPKASQPVKQAAFAGGAASGPARAIQFGRRESRLGDQMEQDVAVEMRLTLNMRRGSDLIGKQQTTVRTEQRRTVTSTAVDDGRTTKVKVHYAKATKQIIDNGAPAADAAVAAANAPRESLPLIEPVEGKTYTCFREPGPDGKLIVTDEAGRRPPPEEIDFVAQQMEMVGRPNPLVQILAGRTIAIGEKLVLPNELARQVFNLGDQVGEVTDFTLTLQQVQAVGGADCAEFAARVEAASTDATQMRIQLEGTLVVQIDSCRAVQVDLTGPIAMSETRGSYSTAYQVIGTGRLHTRIASQYREAQR